jgi:uncharacterized protein DUF6644
LPNEEGREAVYRNGLAGGPDAKNRSEGMDIAGLLASLESSGIATRIRDSLYLFPLIESFHVIGLTLVFGTILIVDLRLLGLASTRRPMTRVTSDIIKWTWAAFLLTATTGFLMFITNANVYYHNFFFRTKIVLLVVAGANMLVFELTSGRTLYRWDTEAGASFAGKAAAVLSLVLWITIIFMGRWIGFTTTQAKPTLDPGINLNDLFQPPDKGNTPK